MNTIFDLGSLEKSGQIQRILIGTVDIPWILMLLGTAGKQRICQLTTVALIIVIYIRFPENIQRTFEFHLSSDAVNLIGSSIEDRLNTAAEQWPDQMTVNTENVLSNTNYSIVLSAESADELTKMTRAVLGKGSFESF